MLDDLKKLYSLLAAFEETDVYNEDGSKYGGLIYKTETIAAIREIILKLERGYNERG